MNSRRRFLPITDELSLLLETHRYVLSWQALREAPFHSFMVSMKPADLRRLLAALDESDGFEFESADGDLRARAEGASGGLALGFRKRGEGLQATLELTGRERAALRDALASACSLRPQS